MEVVTGRVNILQCGNCFASGAEGEEEEEEMYVCLACLKHHTQHPLQDWPKEGMQLILMAMRIK